MDGEKYAANGAFGRITVLNGAPFLKGSYKAGQLLGQVAASGKFTTFDAEAETGAEKIAGVAVKDVTLAADGAAPVAKGEFDRAGVARVMASLAAPVAVGDLIVSQCFNAGIFLN
jgi:hypothetical protein